MISTVDLATPFDPTGYTNITGADLEQLVAGSGPFTDKGFVITTTDDISSNPEVPDAVTTVKFQRYFWRRISTALVTVYVWNPNAASIPTYLKWQTFVSATIGVGTITNAMIADNAITDIKIHDVGWSKITGAPTNLPPSGAASGDLTGTYPSPSIAALAVTTSKIANNAVTHGQLGAQAVQPETDIKPNGVAFTMLRTNAGNSALEYFLPPTIFTSGVVVTTSNAFKVPQVATAGVGDTGTWQMVDVATLISQARYTSADTSINAIGSGGLVVNNNHGLGATPSKVWAVLVCQSTNAGYAAGEIVNSENFLAGASSGGIESNTTAFAIGSGTPGGGFNTKVFASQSALADSLNVPNKTTGANTVIDVTKWKIRVYAEV